MEINYVFGDKRHQRLWRDEWRLLTFLGISLGLMRQLILPSASV